MPLPGSGRPAQDFDDDDKREMLRRYGRRLARMGHCGAHLGEISLRIGPDAFLTHRDSAFRPALNPTDLVVVQAGKVSGSAAVGPMARIHEAIYQAHDWVNGMITAAPDYLLGLCAAHRRLDTHVIPESYMVLDDVPMLPVSSLQDPQAIAARITRENTVLMIENVGIIVASASLYKAFDKMEVARYTAQAVQQAQLLGGVVPIEQEEIGKIRSFFGVHS